MISVEGLVKTFGYFPVLRGVDLQVERGQFLAFLGPNGSGKTTLLRILAGLATPTAGRVTIGGWEIPKETFAIRQQLGVVSHLPLLYDALTAEENLMFFARLYDIPSSERPDRVQTMLKQVGLEKRAKDVVQTFSRGMVQRLAIARALLHDPAILLLDEPYTGLDVDAAALLDQLLTEVAGVKEGIRTVIMTTHDLGRAYQHASHVAILSRGKIGYYGKIENMTAEELPHIYAETVGMVTTA